MTASLIVGGRRRDLGGTAEFLAAMREVAQVTGEEFPHLYGLVYALDGSISAAELEPVRAEARAALEAGGDRLGEHARWLLGQLAA